VTVPHNEENAGYGAKRFRLAPRAFVHAICEPLLDGHFVVGAFMVGLRRCHVCKGETDSGFVVQFKRLPNFRDLTKKERVT
jgi:hypothetical protein